jgi:putative molybdopterin biosynthesis protein
MSTAYAERSTFLTLDEVAETLAVSISTVRRIVKRGDLEAVRVGDQWRVAPSDFDAYVRRGRTRSAAP